MPNLSSLVFGGGGGILGPVPPGGASSRPACLPPTSRQPCFDAPIAASRVALRAVARSVTRKTSMVSVLSRMHGWLGMDRDLEFLGPMRFEMRIPGPSRSSQGGRECPTHQRVRRVVQGHLGGKCSDVLCRIAAAIVRLEGRESEGGRERLAFDFAIELARQSGRLRELLRLGAVAAPPQVGSSGLGLQATPFAEMSSGEPIGPCALARPRSSQRRVGTRVGGKGPRVRLERSAARVVELRSGGDVSARVGRWFLQEGQVGSRCDPSDGQVSLVVDFVIPLLRRDTGGNGYEAPVLEGLTAPVAYHVVVLRRDFRGPRGRAQSYRVNHLVGPTVRARRNIGVQEKKDKIGERVSKLQQLVSPFGKVPPLAPPSSLLMLQQQSLLGDKAVSMAGAERSLSADDSDEGDGGELTLPSITPPSIKGSIRTGDNNSLPWHSFMLIHISCDVI
ncbi:hypothetical protein BHE74_00027481 [Ensete ventricosum]|nr:hypothetical protein BHE74_00027481 [Ensete ventricosum]